jgi:trimeric autotransporter adhesin
MPSRFVSLTTSITAVVLCQATASADVIFVDASQNIPIALQTGTSWGSAFKSLQSGLAAATSGDEIWVADGFYKPTTTTDRSISFVIPTGVKVLGGFKGNEIASVDRDPLLHASVLFGDIGAAFNASDNTFKVVRMSGNNSVLSGLHITGGNANGGGGENLGGGIHVSGSGNTVHECRIYANQAAVGGAGLLLTTGGTTRVTHCIISNNSGPANAVSGGAVNFQNGTPQVYGCVIINNTSGGGVFFLNTTGSEFIANCILRGNVGAGSTLDAQLDIGSTPVVSISANNIEGGLGFGNGTIDADPKFADVDGLDDIPNNGDDNVALRGDSPCIDRGNTVLLPPDDADVDGDGNVAELIPLDMARRTRRIDDPLVTLTGAGVSPFPDIGAFEYERPRTILVNHAATGANNGTSWTNAYTDLQSAIAELSDIKFGGPGEIWVAQGTYKPTTGSDSLISFKLAKDMRIYGGFVGGELSRSLRNPATHETILSGELGAAGPTGNSRTVVSAQGSFIDENTILDGFTIRDGAIQNSFVAGTGLNLQLDAQPTISNCRIVGHLANAGAPVLLAGSGESTPTLVNCVIAGNNATTNGSPGVIFSSSAGKLVNCIVAGNSGTSAINPAVMIINAPASVRNSLIFANTSAGSSAVGSQIKQVGTTPQITISGIQNWVFGAVPGANEASVFDCGTDGDVVDANGADNVFGTADDNYSPQTCSTLLDGGGSAVLPIDVGDLDDDGNTDEEWPVDLAANARLVDLPMPNFIFGPNGRIDIGPIELPSQSLVDPDFNNDGVVDASDLAILLGQWESFGTEFDLSGDCTVNAADLAILLGAWS